MQAASGLENLETENCLGPRGDLTYDGRFRPTADFRFTASFQAMPMPFYVESDVLVLLEPIPCEHIARENNALRFLQNVHRDAQELESVLSRFPGVRYEPLEMHYAISKAIAAVDEKLISDLTSNFGWRGVVYAAFLTAFRPAVQFADYLRLARDGVPHNQWLVDLALREIEECSGPSQGEHQLLIRAIRAVLPAYPCEHTLLREWPTGEKLAQLNLARDAIVEVYQKNGANAAISAIKSSPLSKLLMS